MGWKDNLRPGSIRGVPVFYERRSGQRGARLQVDALPGSDDYVVESLGLKEPRFQLECFLLGQDYDVARERLLGALDRAGPATIVDVWRGEYQGWIADYSFEESKSDGGYCRFTISIVHAGADARPQGQVDTRAQSVLAADAAGLAAVQAFVKRFDVTNWPAFVAEEAAGWLADFTGLAAGMSLVDRFGKAAASLVSARSRFAASLQALAGDPVAAVRRPGFADDIVNLLENFRLASGGGAAALPGLSDLGSIQSVRPVMIETTPSRRRAAANETALARLAERASLVAQVRASAAMRFGSYDAARELRDRLTGELDVAAVEAADNDEPDVFRTVTVLRAHVTNDLIARGGSLARLRAYEVMSPLPALVLAHRLYGDAGRADELIGQNNVIHPGFMPIHGKALTH